MPSKNAPENATVVLVQIAPNKVHEVILFGAVRLAWR
jgi:hypothetical protein